VEGKWNESTRNIAERKKDSQSEWKSNTCRKSGRGRKNKRKHKGRREYSFWEIGRKTFYREMKGNGETTAEMRLDTKMSVRKIQRQQG
jgi:hypothetical protein